MNGTGYLLAFPENLTYALAPMSAKNESQIWKLYIVNSPFSNTQTQKKMSIKINEEMLLFLRHSLKIWCTSE